MNAYSNPFSIVLHSEDDSVFARSQEINGNLVRQLVRWNPMVKGHCERVARMASRIARTLQLSLRSVREAELAGALHDVGKFNLDQEILDKPSSLDEKEIHLIQHVPLHSASIARLLGLSKNIQRGIRERHERPDGFGYPYGLSNEQISDIAKILAVADTFDSLTHEQPYRPALSKVEAIGVIRSKIKTQFDPDIVDAFTRLTLPPVGNKLEM